VVDEKCPTGRDQGLATLGAEEKTIRLVQLTGVEDLVEGEEWVGGQGEMAGERRMKRSRWHMIVHRIQVRRSLGRSVEGILRMAMGRV
jgi:hypothetical protein